MREGDTPLASIMQKAGYTTGAFSDNPFIFKKTSFDRGFDTFVNRQYKSSPFSFPQDEPENLNKPDLVVKNYQRTGDTSKDLIAEAGKWIQEKDSQPWFCYVHILRPHNPYNAPEPFFSRFVDVDTDIPKGEDPTTYASLQEALAMVQDESSDAPPKSEWVTLLPKLYEGSLSYSDHLMNELLIGLDASGALENTWVVIMSDHGEAFEDHGKLFHGRTHPYQEQVHVPLVILPPKGFPDTVRRVDTPVSLVDLLPTLRDVLGLDVPQNMEGQSLEPLLLGESVSFRPYTIFQNMGLASVGIMQDNKTLITDLSPEYDQVLERLAFDLANDPREQHDIFMDDGSFRGLLELTTRYVSSRIQGLSPSEVEFSDEETELLESLGYIQ